MNLLELICATELAIAKKLGICKPQIMSGLADARNLFFDEAIRREASDEPISEVLISKLHHLETTTSYQEIVSWKVPSGKRGRLYQIQFAADDYSHVLWRFTMDGEIKWQDKYLPTAATENWYGATIKAEKEIKIEAKDDDGVGYTAWGAITGTEES